MQPLLIADIVSPMGKSQSDAASIDDPEFWVDHYGDFLYRFALSRIKDPAVAEDLVQETFLAALRVWLSDGTMTPNNNETIKITTKSSISVMALIHLLVI